jgi:DNA-binding CsgD family transcriptional regulator
MTWAGTSTARIVGRDRELQRLADAVATARDGRHITVLIEGDAGMGKSRLLAQMLADFTTSKDVVALAGGIDLAGGELPWGAATELLRTLVGSAGVEPVRSAAGDYAPVLAPLCPPLDVSVWRDSRAVQTGMSVDRTQVLPAVATTLQSLAADRLVWVAIDDLHWVDPQSRDLLAYLLRLGPTRNLLTVVTLRSHDPDTPPDVSALAARMVGQHDTVSIRLDARVASDVAALVTELIGTGPPAPFVDRVAFLSQGNPLMAEQLAAVGLYDRSTLPAAVAEPMLARFHRLGAAARRVVQIASLGEGHLTHRLLISTARLPTQHDTRTDTTDETAQATGPIADEAETWLDDAVRSGLLVFRPADRSYAFAHALLREAVESTLVPSERVDIHRRWAEVLSDPRNHGDDPHLQIAAARHWAETDDDAACVPSSLNAATLTDRLGAVDESANLRLRAWKLWDRLVDDERPAGVSRDDLLLDTLEALDTASRYQDEVAVLERELARPREAAAEPMRHLCLEIIATEVREKTGDPHDASLYVQVLDKVDSLLGAEPSRPVLMALSAVGWHVRWTDPDLSLRAHRRAAEMSAVLGHVNIFVITSLGDNLVERGRVEEAVGVVHTLSQAHTPLDALQREVLLGWARFHGGRFAEAVTGLDRALARFPDPTLAPAEWIFGALISGHSHEALGHWNHLDQLFGKCSRLEHDDWAIRLFLAGDRAQFEVARGNLEVAREIVGPMRAQLPEDPREADPRLLVGPLMAIAKVAAAEGRHGEAVAVLQPVLSWPGLSTYGNAWPVAMAAARFAADQAAAGDTAEPRLLGLTEAAVEALPRLGLHYTARHLHARADLARARGADDPDTWQPALDAWRGIGNVNRVAIAAFRLADAVVRAGDRSGAAEPLAEAWHLATQMGARPLQHDIVGLAQRARIKLDVREGWPGPSARPSGSLARLTNRELEVLRHVALGESNEEIATALFISPKTASVHISRILAKLDVRTRARAAAIAYEAGMEVRNPQTSQG